MLINETLYKEIIVKEKYVTTEKQTLSIYTCNDIIKLYNKGKKWIKIPIHYMQDGFVPFLAKVIQPYNPNKEEYVLFVYNFNYYLNCKSFLNIHVKKTIYGKCNFCELKDLIL